MILKLKGAVEELVLQEFVSWWSVLLVPTKTWNIMLKICVCVNCDLPGHAEMEEVG